MTHLKYCLIINSGHIRCLRTQFKALAKPGPPSVHKGRLFLSHFESSKVVLDYGPYGCYTMGLSHVFHCFVTFRPSHSHLVD